jgi:hypothetical protein
MPGGVRRGSGPLSRDRLAGALVSPLEMDAGGARSPHGQHPGAGSGALFKSGSASYPRRQLKKQRGVSVGT